MPDVSQQVEQQVEQLGRHIHVRFSPERARALRSRIETTRTQRKRRNVAAGVGAGLLLFCVAWFVPKPMQAPKDPLAQTTGPVSPVREVRLLDGSIGRLLDENSRLEVLSAHANQVLLKLHGSAAFHIAKNKNRLLRVQTARVAVEVLGTQFLVREQAEARALVQVSEGRVRVLWDGHQVELSAGDSGVFPPDPRVQTVRPRMETETARANNIAEDSKNPAEGDRVFAQAAPASRGFRGPGSPANPGNTEVGVSAETVHAWRILAEGGHFERAYQTILGRGGMAEFVRGERLGASDLLLLVDVARYSRHSVDAVPPLRQLLSDSPSDPRAPLASFTLGRILLDDLGQPREAAASFRHVLAIEPDGPLSQDALAREVEAWSRAGEQGVARLRAEEYVRRYPTGRRLRSVRRYGDLD